MLLSCVTVTLCVIDYKLKPTFNYVLPCAENDSLFILPITCGIVKVS